VFRDTGLFLSLDPSVESEVREAVERELKQAALQDDMVKTAHQKWIFDTFIASALRRRIAVARQAGTWRWSQRLSQPSDQQERAMGSGRSNFNAHRTLSVSRHRISW
jgi:hypothetical protein